MILECDLDLANKIEDLITGHPKEVWEKFGQNIIDRNKIAELIAEDREDRQ